jgi:hypothetical protein
VARGWNRDDDEPFDSRYLWKSKADKDGSYKRIAVEPQVFTDEKKLKFYRPEDWNKEWISSETIEVPVAKVIDDDDVPF